MKSTLSKSYQASRPFLFAIHVYDQYNSRNHQAALWSSSQPEKDWHEHIETLARAAALAWG
jgi:hypothetical protein